MSDPWSEMAAGLGRGERKQFELVREAALPDEQPVALLAGQSLDARGERHTIGVLVLTNQRVMYRGSLVFEKEQHTFSIADVNSVSLRKSALFGGVSIAVPGTTFALGAADKRRAEAFVAVAQAQLSAQRSAPSAAPGSVSVADELAKLAALRDAGVLTEEEFAGQKARLLG